MSYLDLDFKRPRNKTTKHKSLLSNKLIKKSFAYAAAIALITMGLIYSFQPAPNQQERLNVEALHIPITTDTVKPASQKTNSKKPIELSSPKLIKKTVTIKHGDTLSSLFDQKGIHATILFQLINESKHGSLLKKIHRGQKFHFYSDQANQFVKLQYQPDITQTITYTKDKDNHFSSTLDINPLEAIPVFRQGTIESSLFLAASNNDIPVNVIMNLVSIFGWDIDFALDIRKGDHFKLIYNELYQDGVKIKTGQILAAEFSNRNKIFQAIFYKDPKGNTNYFSPDGKSMRKAFLRNPVKFSRISSRFTNKRWHPVLAKWRSHKGVDYAAPRGTPVYAAGDGRIIHAGTKGGYGRAVIIQHGGKYTTLYGHLNAYSKHARRGKRVKQGQTIGYVGSSGLATGPHLHYEFRISGVHRNPLTVRLPAARPINKNYKADFFLVKDKYLAMLNLMSDN